MLFGVLVWTQPSEKLARLIIKLSPLASLNNNIEIALNYFVAPSSLSTNHPNDIQQGLDFMRQSNPRLAIYAIIFHLAAYFYLPIMIVLAHSIEPARHERVFNIVRLIIQNTQIDG